MYTIDQKCLLEITKSIENKKLPKTSLNDYTCMCKYTVWDQISTPFFVLTILTTYIILVKQMT